MQVVGETFWLANKVKVPTIQTFKREEKQNIQELAVEKTAWCKRDTTIERHQE